MADERRQTLIERDEVAVMFKRVADEQTAINRGWVEVEEAIGSLRGRKFYGAFDEASAEYRVCVQLRESDQPAALGLETGTLPGGRYAQVRLQGEPPAVYALIGPAFETLAKRADRDPGRPGIEFYRRRDVIDLLLPVT
jgi:GyrI-like small molecule binding domain